MRSQATTDITHRLCNQMYAQELLVDLQRKSISMSISKSENDSDLIRQDRRVLTLVIIIMTEFIGRPAIWKKKWLDL